MLTLEEIDEKLATARRQGPIRHEIEATLLRSRTPFLGFGLVPPPPDRLTPQEQVIADRVLREIEAGASGSIGDLVIGLRMEQPA